MRRIKVGIVCDNYKLRKFKRALVASNFEVEVKEFTLNTSAIFIYTEESRLKEIAKICTKLEIDFNHSN